MSLSRRFPPLCHWPRVGASLMLALAPPSFVVAQEDSWYLQTSLYTRHFNTQPEHHERQELLGLERNQADGLLYGAATFRNSYRQRSTYVYGGKAWHHERWPVYAKVSAGLLHGYRGDYRDKIPLNRFGVAPAIIPSLGVRLGPVGVEAVLLGGNALMLNAGYHFR